MSVHHFAAVAKSYHKDVCKWVKCIENSSSNTNRPAQKKFKDA